jgi:DNA-binding transcriptional MerR regulator
MAIMVDENTEWTLTDAARQLGEPQHRLIYFCEKGVVEPDIRGAEGRGSSRRFSTRNLLEFAVALCLRDIEIPASIIAALLHVLRAFERVVRKQIPDFVLPESLRDKNAPDLRVVISDTRKLYFSLRSGKSASKIYGGLDLDKLAASRRNLAALERKLARAITPQRRIDYETFGDPEGSKHARIEVSVTGIARDLRLE